MTTADSVPPLPRDLDWLLTELVKAVPGATSAVLLSSDGLLLSSSQGLDREHGERLAAIASGFQSLARGARRELGATEVRQTILELDSGFLFVTAAGSGACLSVVTGPECDVGLAAYEMNRLVRQVGPHLSTAPRPAGPTETARAPEGTEG
jgi:predicted regulator of Ras-like GTPase activity (Roadblock/LC7/MglB family)